MQRTFASDADKVGEFVTDLGASVASIPGGMRQWWKDGHTSGRLDQLIPRPFSLTETGSFGAGLESLAMP
jgi:hypothetical protein